MPKMTAINHQEVASLYASGMTQVAVGAELGISGPRVCQILKTLGIGIRYGVGKPGNYKRAVATDQHKVMVEMYKAGSTLEEVGAKFGISRERVRQIIKALSVDRLDGGGAIRSFKNTSDKVAYLQAKNERQEAHIRATWGLSLDDYRAHIAEHGTSSLASSPMRKYVQHRKNALWRGIEWNFTFADWWRVWQESGKWDQRGRVTGGTHGYVMARYGDGDTPYSVDTVYICTQSQNSKDSFLVQPDRRAGVRIAMDEQIARIQQLRAKRPPQRESKLTADEVRRIRTDGRRGTEIAAVYGVSTATVSLIRSGKAWTHV